MLRRLNGTSWVFLATSVAALVPLWSVKYLPMVDLPQHAAQVYLWTHFGDPSAHVADIYQLNYLTPYLLGYGLVRVLAAVVGIKAALTAVVSVSVLGLPWALRLLLREVGQDERLALMGFPAAFGYAFYWGFLNYLVAVPLGVLMLAQTVRYAKAPSVRGGVLLAAAALGVFFSHVLVLAVCGGAAGLLVLASAPSVKRALLRVTPLLVPLPVMAGWVRLTHDANSSVRTDLVFREGPLRRLFNLPSVLLSSELEWEAMVMGCALLVLLLLATRPVRTPWRWAPALVALAAYLLAPNNAFGTAFVAPRLAVFVLPFLLVALEPARRKWFDERITHIATTALTLVWLAGLLVRFQVYDADARRYDEVAKHIPPGASMVSLCFELSGESVPGVPFLHFPAWTQAQQGGVLGFSFATFFPEIVRYRPGSEPRITPGLEWFARRFSWQRDGWYDYFVVRAQMDVGEPLFREATEPIELVASSGQWWLYRRASGGGGPADERLQVPVPDQPVDGEERGDAGEERGADGG